MTKKKSEKDLFKYNGPDPFKKHKDKVDEIVPVEDQVQVDKSEEYKQYENKQDLDWKGKFQKQADEKIIDPIFFYKDAVNHIVKPTYNLDDHPNEKYKFAILRSTENGKYVVGGLLHFELNGVQINTELNNVILVDLLNKTVLIKEFDKINETISPEDPEERQYIILMSCINEETGEDEYRWEAMQGRSTMYKYIADNEDMLEIDPDKSLILTDNVAFKDALTVRQFVRYVKNKGMFENDGLEFDDDSAY